MVRWAWALVALAAAQDAETDEIFQVHSMLATAVRSVKSGSLGTEANSISQACVPEEAQVKWRRAFQAAVDTMLKKTRRSMQQGLVAFADSVVELVNDAQCGDLVSLGRLKSQATRLRVFSTSRSLLQFDAKVEYVPLKGLTVGDRDVHTEINTLIVAWVLNKGEEAFGRALTGFLEVFAEEDEDVPEALAAESAPAPEGEATPQFWTTALRKAFEKLGDDSVGPLLTESCLGAGKDTTSIGKDFGDAIEGAFEDMLKKTQHGMTGGLKKLAQATLALLHRAGSACTGVEESAGVQSLKSAATRLAVYATAHKEIDYGEQVEYEAMKVLKVGGIDVHSEINQLIGAWKFNHGAKAVGVALSEFFQDFKEEDATASAAAETEEAQSFGLDPQDATESEKPMVIMLRDALSTVALWTVGDVPSPAPACFSNDEVTGAFARGVDEAIDLLVKRRRKTTQQGLRALADATLQMMAALPSMCSGGPGGTVIAKAAKKLRVLTRRTVVDYGKHIEYEAMKSLQVAGVPIHTELNHFIAAWKLRSQQEAGAPFAGLMQKLDEIEGHDEL